MLAINQAAEIGSSLTSLLVVACLIVAIASVVMMVTRR